jgi:hypothetical protein
MTSFGKLIVAGIVGVIAVVTLLIISQKPAEAPIVPVTQTSVGEVPTSSQATSTVSAADTSDQSLDADMTALDTSMSGLDADMAASAQTE